MAGVYRRKWTLFSDKRKTHVGFLLGGWATHPKNRKISWDQLVVQVDPKYVKRPTSGCFREMTTSDMARIGGPHFLFNIHGYVWGFGGLRHSQSQNGSHDITCQNTGSNKGNHISWRIRAGSSHPQRTPAWEIHVILQNVCSSSRGLMLMPFTAISCNFHLLDPG